MAKTGETQSQSDGPTLLFIEARVQTATCSMESNFSPTVAVVLVSCMKLIQIPLTGNYAT